jgi:hypothetical protein
LPARRHDPCARSHEAQLEPARTSRLHPNHQPDAQIAEQTLGLRRALVLWRTQLELHATVAQLNPQRLDHGVGGRVAGCAEHHHLRFRSAGRPQQRTRAQKPPGEETSAHRSSRAAALFFDGSAPGRTEESMEAKPSSVRTIVTWIGCVLALAGCPADDAASTAAALRAQCVPPGVTVPAGAWVCPEPRTVECGPDAFRSTPAIYVAQSEGITCEGDTFTVSSEGPLVLGTRDVAIANAAGEIVCSAKLTVRDTVAPVIESQTIALWPPNHKLHSIAVEDCVRVVDACEGSALHAEFIWASSDEPVNSIGDGNHDPDILIDDCGHVSLRSERQGPQDGRVYRLGVRAFDSSGNQTEAVCTVLVSHDQSGKQRDKGEVVSAARGPGKGGGAAAGRPNVAVADDEAYRIVFDGRGGSPACGMPEGSSDAGIPDDESDSGVSEPTPDPEEPEGPQ